jgi:hypothetical protein
MQKGVIIEAGSKWTVVLTPAGQFCKVPSKPQYTEGMEISFSIPVSVPAFSAKKLMTKRFLRSFSLVAACLLLIVMIYPFFSGNQAYAAVTIDINPSIELDVDKQANVIDARALNGDGQKVLETIQWKKQKVTAVTLEIIKAAESNGWMNTQNQVIITTTFYESKSQDQGQQWNTMLEDATSKVDPEVTVVLVDGNKQWFDDAKKQDVAPGSYMVIKQAEQQGISLQIDDIKAGQLSDLPNVSGVKVIHPKKKPKESKSLPQAEKDSKPTTGQVEVQSQDNQSKEEHSNNIDQQRQEKNGMVNYGQHEQREQVHQEDKKQDSHDEEKWKKKIEKTNENDQSVLNHDQQKKFEKNSDHDGRNKDKKDEKSKKERD